MYLNIPYLSNPDIDMSLKVYFSVYTVGIIDLVGLTVTDYYRPYTLTGRTP